MGTTGGGHLRSTGGHRFGRSVTKPEELYRLEPPNLARPKRNCPGWPLPVIEEPGARGRKLQGVWTVQR